MDKGQAIKVTRGKYKYLTGAVEEPDAEQDGFYWCWLEQTKLVWRGAKRISVAVEPIRVMLAVGQLEKR